MFDWVTCILCVFFQVPTLIFAYKVCQFELKYLESFGGRESFYPRYANKHPIIAFIMIGMFNLISVFLVYGITPFLIFIFVQAVICLTGFATIYLKKVSPKEFDYVSVFLSFICMVLLLIIQLS